MTAFDPDNFCTEAPVMIIVMFVLYGFVMNTVPQRSLRVAFQKPLFTWWDLFMFFLFATRCH